MIQDLKLVRKTLKKTLDDILERKISLKRANTITYTCSVIVRTVVAEDNLNNKQK